MHRSAPQRWEPLANEKAIRIWKLDRIFFFEQNIKHKKTKNETKPLNQHKERKRDAHQQDEQRRKEKFKQGENYEGNALEYQQAAPQARKNHRENVSVCWMQSLHRVHSIVQTSHIT